MENKKCGDMSDMNDMNVNEELMNSTTDLLDTKSISITSDKTILKLEKIIKRIVDVIGAIAGILLLIPLTILIFIFEKVIGDQGPIFYVQVRIGKNGKLFKMYKYRSMVVDANKKLEQYIKENEEVREEYKKYKKLKQDPRITKVGKLLRKTSLDEFPQFINVLKGEMSLVGPRPYLPKEKKEMNGYFKSITSLKPGITGLWQTSGRSEVTFLDRLALDMNYYREHSLKRDFIIVVKTIEKIIKKEGAI